MTCRDISITVSLFHLFFNTMTISEVLETIHRLSQNAALKTLPDTLTPTISSPSSSSLLLRSFLLQFHLSLHPFFLLHLFYPFCHASQSIFLVVGGECLKSPLRCILSVTLMNHTFSYFSFHFLCLLSFADFFYAPVFLYGPPPPSLHAPTQTHHNPHQTPPPSAMFCPAHSFPFCLQTVLHACSSLHKGCISRG